MVDMDTIASLCKRRGFIFQSSEIYGGLGSAWDYGPLGVEFKNNVKRLWWRDNVQLRDDMVGLDAAISMHPKVWEASGHLASFSDPFTGCAECGRHYRADQLYDALWSCRWFRAIQKVLEGPAGKKNKWQAIANWAKSDGKKLAPNFPLTQSGGSPKGMGGTGYPFDGPEDSKFHGFLEMLANLNDRGSETLSLPCPNCGGFKMSVPKPANLMLETFLGPVKETATKTYLRPETAQGIFVNFDNVLQSSRKKLPFGIAQIGKSFRNEITPGNFTFRTREFEQMEIEYFVMPGTDEDWHQRWVDERFAWYQRYGIGKDNIRLREHTQDELAFYAKRCVDIEYLFPMGWSELEGIANRTDYDLKQHSEFSGKALDYFDEEGKRKVTPYVIEPSAGADRSALAYLVDAYHEEEVRGEKRVVLQLHPELAPIKIAVLPLLKKNPQIVETARKICDDLRKRWASVYDDTAAIGRLYRRQDEVGTPFCVTVDVQTVGDAKTPADGKVTVRVRNTMEQIRVPISAIERTMGDLMGGKWAEYSKE
ncbi:MAG: glycine--tRNA ligase [Candidatus Binatia bacterium]|jgi:glycyl-tRNA synthetase|nr:glycine--tRNA ligase [Candidatus Binatia bacterium]